MASSSSSNLKIIGVLALTLILTAGGVFFAMHMAHERRIASSPDISGAWEGTIKIKKLAIRVVLNITRSNGVYSATADSIDQAAHGVAVEKLDYDYPSLAFEAFGAAYQGKMNAGAAEISGTWKQNGAKMPLTLKRVTDANALPQALTESDYAPRAGSDVQGFWQGRLKVGQMDLRLNLKIAEDTDGTVRAAMDSPDQGAKDLPASGASYERPKLKVEFAGINGTYTGDVQGDKIDGKWKQGGQSFPLVLQRGSPVAAPAAPTADSFAYSSKGDLQGHWKGILSVKTVKLHLVLNIARNPDGNFSATFVSVDQGSGEIPATGVDYASPNLKVDWSGIAANFTGALKDGKLSGTWKQGGATFPLAFTRD